MSLDEALQTTDAVAVVFLSSLTPTTPSLMEVDEEGLRVKRPPVAPRRAPVNGHRGLTAIARRHWPRTGVTAKYSGACGGRCCRAE